jgi:hypothetical protein
VSVPRRASPQASSLRADRVSAAPSLPEVPGDAVTGVLLRHPELDALALHHEIKEEFGRVAKAWTADHPEPERPRAIAG